MRASRMSASVAVLAAVAVVCAPGGSAGVRRHDAGTVSVLYAGSLVNVMEQKIGPAFERATGYGYQGFGAGSKAVASDIKGGLERGDVFISASPSVNNSLLGGANGAWASWYGTFATSPLVIGYNPKSSFAADFKTQPWWQVLGTPGLLLGRTDPLTDPKGELTVQFMHRAGVLLHRPNLEQTILGATENTKQIFPEETLLGRLEAGQLDAGFFYSVEATEAHIPTVVPPLGKRYSARYTVTILNRAPNQAGALAFVEFLLGPRGTALLEQDGFRLVTGQVGGNRNAVPAPVASLLAR